jgi:hypothetical protein
MILVLCINMDVLIEKFAIIRGDIGLICVKAIEPEDKRAGDIVINVEESDESNIALTLNNCFHAGNVILRRLLEIPPLYNLPPETAVIIISIPNSSIISMITNCMSEGFFSSCGINSFGSQYGIDYFFTYNSFYAQLWTNMDRDDSMLILQDSISKRGYHIDHEGVYIRYPQLNGFSIIINRNDWQMDGEHINILYWPVRDRYRILPIRVAHLLRRALQRRILIVGSSDNIDPLILNPLGNLMYTCGYRSCIVDIMARERLLFDKQVAYCWEEGKKKVNHR